MCLRPAFCFQHAQTLWYRLQTSCTALAARYQRVQTPSRHTLLLMWHGVVKPSYQEARSVWNSMLALCIWLPLWPMSRALRLRCGTKPSKHLMIMLATDVLCLRFMSALTCRFQQDALLGVASIPLSPLLQESWVQGTAPVLSVMSKADGQAQESMQVCAKHHCCCGYSSPTNTAEPWPLWHHILLVLLATMHPGCLTLHSCSCKPKALQNTKSTIMVTSAQPQQLWVTCLHTCFMAWIPDMMALTFHQPDISSSPSE